MANVSRKAGTNSSKKESTRMEFTEEQMDELSMFIAKELRTKVLRDKLQHLVKAVEDITEETGYTLRSRMKTMLKSDAFLIEEPVPEPDANHVDYPEPLM